MSKINELLEQIKEELEQVSPDTTWRVEVAGFFIPSEEEALEISRKLGFPNPRKDEHDLKTYWLKLQEDPLEITLFYKKQDPSDE